MDIEDHSVKHYFGLIIITSITLYVIYWIYQNIIMSKEVESTNQGHKRSSKRRSKGKMTINCTGLLFKNEHEIVEKEFYSLLDQLSDKYDLFLIVLIDEKSKPNELIQKFKMIIEDNIVFQHRILFCTTIEGACAMVRSIDPTVHIEHNEFVVVNLIRVINEFWFVSDKPNKIHEKIKNDSNNAKINIDDLMKKIIFYKDVNEIKLI